MEKNKILRINYLAKKAKTSGLTAEEAAEQRMLRDEYRAEIRRSLEDELDRIEFTDAPLNGRKGS